MTILRGTSICRRWQDDTHAPIRVHARCRRLRNANRLDRVAQPDIAALTSPRRSALTLIYAAEAALQVHELVRREQACCAFQRSQVLEHVGWLEMRRNSAIHLSQRRGQFPERSCTQGSCEDSLTAVRSRARAVSSSLPRVPPSGSKNTCVDAAFRRGMIRTARFGPDFQGVFYGALWTRIAVARTPVVSFR